MAREYDPQLAEMGAKIVARREELGMTATELAIYADITSAALSRIENGQSEAKVTTLMKIADILTVPLSYFQSGDSESSYDIPPELLALIPKLNRTPLGTTQNHANNSRNDRYDMTDPDIWSRSYLLAYFP